MKVHSQALSFDQAMVVLAVVSVANQHTTWPGSVQPCPVAGTSFLRLAADNILYGIGFVLYVKVMLVVLLWHVFNHHTEMYMMIADRIR